MREGCDRHWGTKPIHPSPSIYQLRRQGAFCEAGCAVAKLYWLTSQVDEPFWFESGFDGQEHPSVVSILSVTPVTPIGSVIRGVLLDQPLADCT
ncbi:hypothetical protein Pla22_29160 [Rubripirellula amarantea]|uniref:Uncharacterized protein n=1 Tax=Rubripirellula amarantea TaxID=2527999 RepID=A0A5C5WHA8_9BACT|nr:hypothetical protein Pla22_29160 [Rubripirellula amarantea]